MSFGGSTAEAVFGSQSNIGFRDCRSRYNFVICARCNEIEATFAARTGGLTSRSRKLFCRIDPESVSLVEPDKTRAVSSLAIRLLFFGHSSFSRLNWSILPRSVWFKVETKIDGIGPNRPGLQARVRRTTALLCRSPIALLWISRQLADTTKGRQMFLAALWQIHFSLLAHLWRAEAQLQYWDSPSRQRGSSGLALYSS